MNQKRLIFISKKYPAGGRYLQVSLLNTESPTQREYLGPPAGFNFTLFDVCLTVFWNCDTAGFNVSARDQRSRVAIIWKCHLTHWTKTAFDRSVLGKVTIAGDICIACIVKQACIAVAWERECELRGTITNFHRTARTRYHPYKRR